MKKEDYTLNLDVLNKLTDDKKCVINRCIDILLDSSIDDMKEPRTLYALATLMKYKVLPERTDW